MKELINKIKAKCEEKRKKKELERKVEIYNLREKQREREIFITYFRKSLDSIQKSFNDLEEKEKQYNKFTNELEENLRQIDVLNSRPAWFIIKIINNWKSKKLAAQCANQKQKIDEFEKVIHDKKEELHYLLNDLLQSFN